MANNQKGCHAGQSEAGAQAERPGHVATDFHGCPLACRPFDLHSTRQAEMPALLSSVPSVDSVPSADSEFSEQICCPRNLRQGQSSRKAFGKLRRERRAEEKSFFAKRTHLKTSDIQLSNCRVRSYEIYRKSGIGFVIGFVMLKKATRKPSEAIGLDGPRGLCIREAATPIPLQPHRAAPKDGRKNDLRREIWVNCREVTRGGFHALLSSKPAWPSMFRRGVSGKTCLLHAPLTGPKDRLAGTHQSPPGPVSPGGAPLAVHLSFQCLSDCSQVGWDDRAALQRPSRLHPRRHPPR